MLALFLVSMSKHTAACTFTHERTKAQACAGVCGPRLSDETTQVRKIRSTLDR